MKATKLPGEPLTLDPPPDEDLRRRVNLYLMHAGHRPVQMLSVDAQNGVVTLRGRVPTFYARQLALACASRVAGVRAVVDHIETAGADEPSIRMMTE